MTVRLQAICRPTVLTLSARPEHCGQGDDPSEHDRLTHAVSPRRLCAVNDNERAEPGTQFCATHAYLTPDADSREVRLTHAEHVRLGFRSGNCVLCYPVAS
jgi:hypothetical protein